MTMIADPHILSDIVGLMTQLAGDWEYSGSISPETKLLADLGLESLDLVVLGTAIQKRHGRLPFAELLADIGQRPIEGRDISVGELVLFVSQNRGQAIPG
jgi:acyl carrier protein